jgi:chaperonin GroES
MKKIVPLGENVLLKLSEAEKVTKSGIILPSKNEDEKSHKGEVIAVGEGKKINKEIRPGVKVVFEKYEGSEIELDDKKYILIKSKNILAVVK